MLGMGSLKSLLNSLASYDIKQTHNALSLHLRALCLIHSHITFSQSFFYISILGISLFLSQPQPPVSLSVMLFPFKCGCHHYFPTRTQFPPSHPSPCLSSYPLLSSSPQALIPYTDCTTSVSHNHMETLWSERIQGFTCFTMYLVFRSLPTGEFMFICLNQIKSNFIYKAHSKQPMLTKVLYNRIT